MNSAANAGRVNQKRRTRRALLQAARELVEAGGQPSLQDVADRAMISRATAYRYYSSIETLLQEAVLDGIAAQITEHGVSDAATDGVKLEDRLEAIVSRILSMVLENESLFRTYLRGVVADDQTHRGGRRVQWLAEAVGEDRHRLPQTTAERMVAALSLLTGIETVIVAKDVCGLDNEATRDLCRWTARAIVAAARVEAES